MKKTVFTLISLAFLLASCTREEIGDGPDTTKAPAEKRVMPTLAQGVSHEGIVYIKVKPEAAATFEAASLAAAPSDGGPVLSGISTMDAALSDVNAYRMERIFRHGGRFENRHREAGLHLWYRIVFDEGVDLMTAANRLAEIEEVDMVQGSPLIERIGGDNEPVSATPQQMAAMQITPSALPTLYDDPQLGNQWHYHNAGGKTGFEAGADVNLFRAWEVESGNPEVIVSIVDGGVDHDHPDLHANMWVNEAEKNGTEGIDDDYNGYIDDVYGYNFVQDIHSIVAHSHGTHVAGTVAAVNNNGIGVSGVAGGDGTSGSGARLMTCQVFHDYVGPRDEAKAFADAIIYGADNGAVISQNSWGYVRIIPLDPLTKNAIDYFVDYAGIDPDTRQQTGPMKGGIVVFAAGNSNTDGQWMPGAYEKCFSVAAMAPNFKRSSFSTYGTWVDITAPGGEYGNNIGITGDSGEVYSTLPYNQYGYNLGTSMACPHVSGIAALAVSKYGVGKPGYTPEMLKERLMASVDDIYGSNSTYMGQLGAGLVDAFKVLTNQGGTPPQPVGDLEVEWTFEGAYLTWTITSDPDSGQAARYDILCNKNDLNGVDFSNPPAGTWKTIARVNGKSAGEKMSARVKGMTLGESYYISIAAADEDSNLSTAYTVWGTTEPNKAPRVTVPEDLTLTSSEYREVPVKVLDLEGYDWTYSFTAGSGALTVEKVNDEMLMFIFDCMKTLPGSYTATLTVEDLQGLTTEVTIPYVILENNAPRPIKESQELVITGIGTKLFALDGLFVDDDNDVLSFEVKLADSAFATVSNSNGILTITTNKLGTSTLTITARDPRGLSCTANVTLVCRDPERRIDLYPVPVKKDGVLNIRMGDDVYGTIDVTLYNNANGVKVFNQEVAILPSTQSTINIASLSTGTYKVVVKYGDNMEVSKIITKL